MPREITADRPSNIRTLERYLLLAGDLPGLKFITTLKPSTTKPGASTLIVEVAEKPLDLDRPRRQPRHAVARSLTSFSARRRSTTSSASTRRFTITYAGVWPLEELQYFRATYRQVLNSEGLPAFVNAQLRLGPAGHRVAGAASMSSTGHAHGGRGGPDAFR